MPSSGKKAPPKRTTDLGSYNKQLFISCNKVSIFNLVICIRILHQEIMEYIFLISYLEGLNNSKPFCKTINSVKFKTKTVKYWILKKFS